MVYITTKNTLARVGFRVLALIASVLIAMVAVDRFVYDFISYNSMVNMSYIAATILFVYALIAPNGSMLQAKFLEDNKGYAYSEKDDRKVQCTSYYIATIYANSSMLCTISAMLYLFTDSSVFNTVQSLICIGFFIGFNIWFRDFYLPRKHCEFNIEKNELEKVIWTYC